jgi:Animal haem peroxidase
MNSMYCTVGNGQQWCKLLFCIGISSPRTLSVVMTNQGRALLPGPREISTTLSRGENRPHPTVTLMTMQFGQFLDHDFVNSTLLHIFFCWSVSEPLIKVHFVDFF